LRARPEQPDVYAFAAGERGLRPAGPGPADLELPPRLDPRVRELARALAAGTEDPARRIDRTLSRLAAEYEYSLSPGRFRTADPLAEFLFEKRRGYCEYFASAAAVLLRLQGIPTRYVAGFSVSESARSGRHFVVRESDAHAWIDAWVPGRGWMELDPTPAAQFAAVREQLRPSGLSALGEWLRSQWVEARLALARGGLRAWALVLAGLAAAALALRRWRSRTGAPRARDGRRTEATPVDPQLAALLARVDRALARRGLARPVHRAPREHLAASRDRLPPESAAALQAAIDCYYRARYAGEAFSPERLRSTAASLD
ncbi:MAG TPA: transglutaminase-like domain-containing protein, partial [Vicinamibacteria bacterium]|nr:transglutaminase-like domain-containing protein [Vicinamibacteria bacterium]